MQLLLALCVPQAQVVIQQFEAPPSFYERLIPLQLAKQFRDLVNLMNLEISACLKRSRRRVSTKCIATVASIEGPFVKWNMQELGSSIVLSTSILAQMELDGHLHATGFTWRFVPRKNSASILVKRLSSKLK